MATKPAFELRRGLIKVRVWRKRTSSGLRHTVMVTRLYRNGDVWKESSRFGRDDIPLVRYVLDKAHTWIYANS
jgi:N6-adenosine-specific RNA methylase IME4